MSKRLPRALLVLALVPLALLAAPAEAQGGRTRQATVPTLGEAANGWVDFRGRAHADELRDNARGSWGTGIGLAVAGLAAVGIRFAVAIATFRLDGPWTVSSGRSAPDIALVLGGTAAGLGLALVAVGLSLEIAAAHARAAVRRSERMRLTVLDAGALATYETSF